MENTENIYFVNCSSNIDNYDLCLEHGKAGFPSTGYYKGDFVYLIVKKNKVWYCGAKGFLGERTEDKPWKDSQKYKEAFDINWQRCEEFEITKGFQKIYHPNFGLAIQGKKNLNTFKGKGEEFKDFMNANFISIDSSKEIKKEFSKKNKKMSSSSNLSPKEIIQQVHQYILGQGFNYSLDDIANFYLCLKTKPFVILAGISGTGKTQLPRQFAAALGMTNEQVIQIPVRPDWTDGSDLLGYVNFEGVFQAKDLTTAILEAKANKDNPYFFILDEMNLARVEHYFSDFLSIIETREWVDQKNRNQIKTDPILKKEGLENASNKEQFKDVFWPDNLYLIGTVNMDETTHPFSRKVLDRANSIEMNEVDLNWMPLTKSIAPLQANNNAFLRTKYLKSVHLDKAQRDSIKEEMGILIKINEILKKADLHFAYRVRDEVAFYLLLNKEYELMDSNTALDYQIVQKVLPRIHGSSKRVQNVLVTLLNLLESQNLNPDSMDYEKLEKINEESFTHKKSSKKIIFMLKRFEDDRFTSFWL